MSLLAPILFLALGFAVGLGHFAAIAREADHLAHGGTALPAILLRLGRFAATILMLLIASRQGWPALLAAAVGFMGGRQIILRRFGRAR